MYKIDRNGGGGVPKAITRTVPKYLYGFLNIEFFSRRHGGFKVILSRFQNFKEKFIFESILFLRNSILQVDYITSLR